MAQWRKGRGRSWRSPPERLEDAHMKDVVDARSFWQQQMVRDVADAFGHLERTLAAFDAQLLFTQRYEDGLDMLEVRRPRRVVD